MQPYTAASGSESKLSSRTVSKYFNIVDELKWDTFDDYVSHVHTINYVSFVKQDWITSVCSCVFLAKNYYCHHIIGLAVHKGKAAYLDIHKQIPIGQSRPRGQPKKTTSALVYQEDGPLSSDSSASTGEFEADSSPMKKKKDKSDIHTANSINSTNYINRTKKKRSKTQS